MRTGTVRRGIREAIADWEQEHPHLRENILKAMSNVQPGRLLDTRLYDPDTNPDLETENEKDEAELHQIVTHA